MNCFKKSFGALAAILVLSASPAISQEEDATTQPPADAPEQELSLEDAPPPIQAAARLLAIVSAIDEDAELAPNGATFTVEEVQVTLLFDVNAERMRLYAPVRPAAGLDTDDLERLMQANFDSALDARYAIARGALWSSFMHPLTSLTDQDFISGVSQTVSLVKTYGSTFSSSESVFRGGDSTDEVEKLIEERLSDGAKEI